jgi:hypothetical protein
MEAALNEYFFHREFREGNIVIIEIPVRTWNALDIRAHGDETAP